MTVFHHEAVLYDGEAEFIERLAPFVLEGVEAGEPVLVAVGLDKARALNVHLGAHANRSVEYVDMESLGRNPACIIPAWREFVEGHPGRHLRGIGEPVWFGRSDEEIVECHRHEALLNLAFDDTADLDLLCPYDVGALGEEIVDRVRCTHPHVSNGAGVEHSDGYMTPSDALAALDDPLLAPASDRVGMNFSEPEDLSGLRSFIGGRAKLAGLAHERRADFVLAVSEIAANSIEHTSTGGSASVWEEPGRLICEVRDGGRIEDLLAGRERPRPDAHAGRGLWLANQLCDLVQVRSRPGATVIRLQMRAAAS